MHGGDDQIQPVETDRGGVERVTCPGIDEVDFREVASVFVDGKQAQSGLTDEGDVVAGGGCFGDERDEHGPGAGDGDGGSAGQGSAWEQRGERWRHGHGAEGFAAYSDAERFRVVGPVAGAAGSGAVMVGSSVGAWSRRPPGTVAIRRRRTSSWVALSSPVRSGMASAVAMWIDLSPCR